MPPTLVFFALVSYAPLPFCDTITESAYIIQQFTFFFIKYMIFYQETVYEGIKAWYHVYYLKDKVGENNE